MLKSCDMKACLQEYLINKNVKYAWNNQEIDWLIDLINKTVVDGISKEVNLNTLESLVNLLSSYELIITKSILEILLENCPVLNDIFASIVGYQSIDYLDILKITNNATLIDVLVMYGLIKKIYHDSYLPINIYEKENFALYSDVLAPKIKENEKQELIKKAKKDVFACEKIVLNYLDLIKYIAKEKFNSTEEDLMQEGTIALIKAIKKYNGNIINNIDNYLAQAIYNGMYNYFNKEEEKKDELDSFQIEINTSIEQDILDKECLNYINYLSDSYRTILESYYGLNNRKKIAVKEIMEMNHLSRTRVFSIINNAIFQLKKIVVVSGYELPIYGKYHIFNIDNYREALREINYSSQNYNWKYLGIDVSEIGTYMQKSVPQEVKIALAHGFIPLKMAFTLSRLEDKDVFHYLALALANQLKIKNLLQYMDRGLVRKKEVNL